MRRYEIERDEKGLPTKMLWLGDTPDAVKLTKHEMELQKMAEWEKSVEKML